MWGASSKRGTINVKHPINTVNSTFAAPSAVPLPCKSNYVLMSPGLKIVENEAECRNCTSLVVNKWRYEADVSLVWGRLICHEEITVCDKLPCRTPGRGNGGWNGSRGRRIRSVRLVADAWRNLTRVFTETGWNKVHCVMCQNEVVMFVVCTFSRRSTYRPRDMCCRHSSGRGIRCSSLFISCFCHNTIFIWEVEKGARQQIEKQQHSNLVSNY